MTGGADTVGPSAADGLSLTPFRGLRPRADGTELSSRLCPPYDVISPELRTSLLSADASNAVAVILPEPTAAGYADAARRLQSWVDGGILGIDEVPALYIYEMREPGGNATRGLLGAVELRDPADDVILPHENTMAGPVADRLAVMTATGTDLEPIYLVYDGGGAASELVKSADARAPIASTTTADGVTHRLWAVIDAADHRAVAADLRGRKALIADGHHRYATYQERQRLAHDTGGAGPWDRGMALLVDTSEYGPQVHAIHRAVAGLALDDALDRLPDLVDTAEFATPREALDAIAAAEGFSVAIADGVRSVVVTDPSGVLRAAARRPDESDALAALDVTVVHRGLIEQIWNLIDDVETVRYAHNVPDALSIAAQTKGLAILLRPTPVDAVAAVAAAGARMPRKSTLFTPKPASGLVLRRLVDQPG